MTDRYAVIGNPISHSKSPQIHTAFAHATAQDLEYTAMACAADDFERAVLGFRDSGGRGMNVTAPFKLQAFRLADERSRGAELAGAANALKFDGDRIVAESFDGVGLVNDIQRNLQVTMRGARVLLLGAGGAARGALLPFLEQEPATLAIANRTPEKARTLAEPYAGRVIACGFEDLAGQAFDIVVNATSASQGAEPLSLPPNVFADGCLAYELVYGRGLTPFLRSAREAGVQHLADGVGMLVEQAAEAFVWWRGVRPETGSLIKRLYVPLA